MRTGELNKQVTWQYETKVSDGMGGYTASMVDACTVWAAIWPVSAKEIVQAGQPAMEITHRIRLRFRKPFSPAWRGKYGERYFNIVSIVNPKEANEWLDVLCKEEFAT